MKLWSFLYHCCRSLCRPSEDPPTDIEVKGRPQPEDSTETEDRRPKPEDSTETEDRRPKPEERRPKQAEWRPKPEDTTETEDRRPKPADTNETEDRRPKPEDRRPKPGDTPETEERRPKPADTNETEDRRPKPEDTPETEERRPKPEERRPKPADITETEDRRPKPGDTNETEDQRPKPEDTNETEDRRPKPEDQRPKPEERRPKPEDITETEERRPKPAERRPKPEDQRPKPEDITETEERRPKPEERRPKPEDITETEERRPKPEDITETEERRPKPEERRPKPEDITETEERRPKPEDITETEERRPKPEERRPKPADTNETEDRRPKPEDPPDTGVLSRVSDSEEPTAETEEGRPAAKRHRSSDSAAQTFTEAKKSAVRTDVEDTKETKAVPGQKPSGAGLGKRRRRREDLFHSTEVFHRADAQVIQAGAELKKEHVFDVKTIVLRITQGARTELDTIRAIWVWLCHNIEYDVSGFLGRSKMVASPEEVIATGRAVCSGYSNLCSQMCRVVGVQCQEVHGYGKGVSYKLGQSLKGVKANHQWNAVMLSGQWFLLDACWGAGHANMEQESFVKRFDDFYFLTDPEEFVISHFPDEEAWQLLDPPISIEEFERSVLRKSTFFNLGLRLIQPQQCHVITDDGEANISLSFSRPTKFTFKTTPHQGRLHSGSSKSSWGILTASQGSMKLRVLPPASGCYDVEIFAGPEESTASLHWVCSFIVECPVPRAMEEIPENPSWCWGLMPSAGGQGVSGSSVGSEVVQVEQGSCEVVLQTSRPLELLCELVHPKLELGVAKRCLATQSQSHALTCHVLCPLPGFYRLSMFIREYEKKDVKFESVANFLLHCQGKLTSLEELFPPDLSSTCGPGLHTSEYGFSEFSHTTAVVTTHNGNCNISFHNQRDLKLLTELSRDETMKKSALPLSRYVFCSNVASQVTVSASLPGPGLYRLGLFAKTTPGHSFEFMCDFVLRNTSDRPGTPFPLVYSDWAKDCVLLEPTAGVLDPESWVRFRLRVPGAQRLCAVLGQTWTDLNPDHSGVWEAEVFTGAGPQLKVVSGSGQGTNMAVLMTFDIGERWRGGLRAGS